jgi:hypothetical protein
MFQTAHRVGDVGAVVVNENSQPDPVQLIRKRDTDAGPALHRTVVDADSTDRPVQRPASRVGNSPRVKEWPMRVRPGLVDVGQMVSAFHDQHQVGVGQRVGIDGVCWCGRRRSRPAACSMAATAPLEAASSPEPRRPAETTSASIPGVWPANAGPGTRPWASDSGWPYTRTIGGRAPPHDRVECCAHRVDHPTFLTLVALSSSPEPPSRMLETSPRGFETTAQIITSSVRAPPRFLCQRRTRRLRWEEHPGFCGRLLRRRCG